MSKLGYTWYPKDWGNSESVFELNLTERGLYRELIDLAMLNDNKIEIKFDVWSRKFAIDTDSLKSILGKLSILNLIEINKENLFIPSCEPRLNLIRGGRNGGKKSKPNSKPNSKPTQKPFESHEEKNLKPNSNQIEKKLNIKENEIKINNKSFVDICLNSEQWLETICVQKKISLEQIKKDLLDFENHLIISGNQKKYIEDFKTHFSNWLTKKPKKENEPIIAGRQTLSTIQSNADWSMIENPYVKKENYE
jgi:hypothetical protein